MAARVASPLAGLGPHQAGAAAENPSEAPTMPGAVRCSGAVVLRWGFRTVLTMSGAARPAVVAMAARVASPLAGLGPHQAGAAAENPSEARAAIPETAGLVAARQRARAGNLPDARGMGQCSRRQD
ncbi:hypothetical protein GCM10010199_48460 [Dactylosporangium roseum]